MSTTFAKKPKPDRRKPESTWASEYRDLVRELRTIAEQQKELRDRRKSTMALIPDGVYHLVGADERVFLSTGTSAGEISIEMLKRYLTPEIIERCRGSRRVTRTVKVLQLTKKATT